MKRLLNINYKLFVRHLTSIIIIPFPYIIKVAYSEI